jgi:acyl-coenzyme A thioesterase PaaI-like protein
VDDITTLLRRLKDLRESMPEVGPTWLAKRVLAAQLRRFSNAICASTAAAEDIIALARALEEKLELLHRIDPAGTAGAPPDASVVLPGMEDFFDRGPVAGKSNPIAPPATLDIDIDNLCIVGEVTFGKAFEGAPGCVHGGFTAAVLDEALGMACIFAGGPAMTAELTTRYRRHAPIETRLRIEARMDGIDGKKIRTSGEISAGDVVIADSSGLYIAVGTQKFADLFKARRDGAGE